ncbi:hypothetical protein MVEN_02081100 [Mycena venus]|uniref:Nuf2 DHR10-like domain-containing protein n=1 Tax=Mycena venus TaxID=2733690 RepID=A0A8H6XD59_9AGAR|nr:hypothetical protein MVEN_02081100 [Mycena venus]
MVDKDLHATSLTSHILLYHLTRLATAAKVEDFCAKDIQSPERERTLYIPLRKLRDHSDEIVAERDRVTRRLAGITQEIDIMKAKMAEDEPRCEQLRAENATLRAKILKDEKTALIERKDGLNNEIASMSEAMTRTRSRIVQSPERIKRTITQMSSTAMEDKQTVALHEAKARDLQAKINAFSNIEKDVRGCVEQLQTIEKEVHSTKQIERKELHLRQERVQKQLSNAHEKLERAQRHAEERKASSQKAIERLQREYDEMVVERRDNDKQVEELRGEASKLGNRTNEIELNQLLAEYWKLRHDTDLYMETPG